MFGKTFSRKQTLTFHAYYFLGRQFAWNASLLSGKIKQKYQFAQIVVKIKTCLSFQGKPFFHLKKNAKILNHLFEKFYLSCPNWKHWTKCVYWVCQFEHRLHFKLFLFCFVCFFFWDIFLIIIKKIVSTLCYYIIITTNKMLFSSFSKKKKVCCVYS